MARKPPLHRGDVVIVPFPFTNLKGNKRRPAVVIAVGANQSDLLFAFVSSVVPSSPTIADLVIKSSDTDFKATGLKVTSVLRLNKFATIERNLVTRRLGQLTSSQIQQVDHILVRALNIDIKPFLTQERKCLRQLLEDSGLEVLQDTLDE